MTVTWGTQPFLCSRTPVTRIRTQDSPRFPSALNLKLFIDTQAFNVALVEASDIPLTALPCATLAEPSFAFAGRQYNGCN